MLRYRRQYARTPDLTAVPTRRSPDLTLFSELDYPSAAIRAAEQGTVAFRVLVGTNGRVAACEIDRKSTRLNSSHPVTLYAVMCLKTNNSEITKVERHGDRTQSRRVGR